MHYEQASQLLELLKRGLHELGLHAEVELRAKELDVEGLDEARRRVL